MIEVNNEADEYGIPFDVFYLAKADKEIKANTKRLVKD